MMEAAGSFCVPGTHPSLAGHFPGDPIVPGVVLLDEALACLPPGLSLLTAKFVTPVRPGETVTVTVDYDSNGNTHFFCGLDGRGWALVGVARAVR